MAFFLAFTFALALAVPSTSPVAAGAGVVSGRVSIVKNGNALSEASNCVVWIEAAHRSTTPAPGTSGAVAAVKGLRPEMKSQGKKFVPRVVTVEKNAEVDFPNVDPIFHNVFSV